MLANNAKANGLTNMNNCAGVHVCALDITLLTSKIGKYTSGMCIPSRFRYVRRTCVNLTREGHVSPAYIYED